MKNCLTVFRKKEALYEKFSRIFHNLCIECLGASRSDGIKRFLDEKLTKTVNQSLAKQILPFAVVEIVELFLTSIWKEGCSKTVYLVGT